MYQKLIRWLDPIIIIGLVISIFLSIAMLLTGEETIPTLTIGLLSTILTLLVDAIARIQKAEGSFLNATGVAKILSDKTIGAALQEISDNYEKIKRYSFGHYDSIAETALDECRFRLREIADGSVVVRAKTVHGYGVRGVEEARRDIKAIHIGNMDFWSSDFGRRYFELNRAATKRGIRITRIFALEPEAVKNSLEKLKEQERAGVRVLIVGSNRVNKEFVIFDDEILIDFEVNSEKDDRLERIILDSTKVKRKREEFQELVTRYAKPIKDVLATS